MVGTTLKHYQVEELLGKGGMGVVYRARDVRLNRPVALKVLKGEFTENADRRRRFLQEARSASAVTHPAIAQIYDVDEVDGTTFIAMEFVEGQTVRQLVQRKELDAQAAVEVALQVVEGLARAHEAGIVHRDIKSDNIMVTRDGHAKILDFGLSKLLDAGCGDSLDGTLNPSQLETVAHQTQLGTVLGTIAYMSPEQARGKQVDPRSDLFSVGVVLYEMVTGELPFKGDSPLDTMHAIAFDEVPAVTVIRQYLPPALQRIVSRCLRKNPNDRYPDGAALAADLKTLKRDMESGIQRGATTAERLQGVREWVQSSMPLGPAGVVVGVAIVALLGYLLFSDASLGSVIVLGVLGLFGFRFVRNRRARMVKRLTQKLSKLKEVRAITVRGNRLTLIVDQAEAKTYLRVNSLVESVNRKLFQGEPIEAAVRDDLSDDQFQLALRESGVAYVRDDPR